MDIIDVVTMVSDDRLYFTNQGVFIVKNLTIEKLEPKDMGQYHIIRKVNELVSTVNELVKLLQEIGDPDILTTGFIGDKAQDAVDRIQSSDTSTD